ncbi:MAG: hypothetical protein GC208_10310 [Alphaproteobacteria bacterium]|nr:hypothetical protein [Alphaproteobacteria bacterium]
MAENITGRDVVVRVYQNGQVMTGIPVIRFEDDPDQEMRSRQLLGETRTQKSLIVHGYRGTFEVDVESAQHHVLAKFINDNDKAQGRSNTYELAIQVAENYRDGSTKRYRYVRCKIMLPRTSMQGRQQDVTARFEFHAEDKVYL